MAKIFKFGTANDVANLNVDNLINVAPSNIILSSASIAENNSINDVVGTLSTTHCDNSSFTYTIGGTDASSFNINSNQLRASSAFDFETKNSYSITIISTDGNNLSFTKAFTITVTDVAESVTRWEVTTFNSSGTVTGVHHVSGVQYCEGNSLATMPSSCFQLNHFVRYVTSAGGCGSTSFGRGKITSFSVSAGVPTAYINGKKHYPTSNDSENDTNGTTC